jgi:hypothetical protein
MAWIDNTLDTLAGAKWFPLWAFRAVIGKWICILMTRRILHSWQVTVIPFGIWNAAVTFELLMETVRIGLTYEACLVYLDHLIISGRTFNEHLLNLRKVFQRLWEASLKLNPEKCQFVQKELQYFGYIVTPEGKHNRSGMVAVLGLVEALPCYIHIQLLRG